jgi:hypothetical protein
MAVRIQLDNPPPHYTNLDIISGRVILNLKSDTTVEEIAVKLEGESKTRLDNSKGYYDDPNAAEQVPRTVELEVHKILYETASVFEPTGGGGASRASSYTIRSGQHEYPFCFKVNLRI